MTSEVNVLRYCVRRTFTFFTLGIVGQATIKRHKWLTSGAVHMRKKKMKARRIMTCGGKIFKKPLSNQSKQFTCRSAIIKQIKNARIQE